MTNIELLETLQMSLHYLKSVNNNPHLVLIMKLEKAIKSIKSKKVES